MLLLKNNTNPESALSEITQAVQNAFPPRVSIPVAKKDILAITPWTAVVDTNKQQRFNFVVRWRRRPGTSLESWSMAAGGRSFFGVIGRGVRLSGVADMAAEGAAPGAPAPIF